MSHYDRSQQDIRTWQGVLHWSATGRMWYAIIGKVHISVPETVYSRLLVEYLATYGVTRKTYMEIMAPAEERWRRQCELEYEFRSNLQQWLFSDIPGVIIRIENEERL